MPCKVFAWIILDRVRHHLLEHQCPEQSGFTPKRSTQQGLLAANAYLCIAFDSVNWDASLIQSNARILGHCGVPPKLINLMSELYSGTESAVRCGGTISDLFAVVTGVRQGVCTGPHTF